MLPSFTLLLASLCGYLQIVYSQFEESCQGPRPGDCDPTACGGSCEARYIRFYDSAIRGDRTTKNCQCAQEKICQLIGMHSYAGCRSYTSLSASGQRMIRLWSMDRRDRQNRFSNEVSLRYFDKKRHQQLLYGNSRFCCRTESGRIEPEMSIVARPATIRMRALRLRSAASRIPYSLLPCVLLVPLLWTLCQGLIL